MGKKIYDGLGSKEWYPNLMSKPSLLNTSTINVRTLFSNGKHYSVPAFQRDYSWRQEQWEDLWLDLLELEQSGRYHYMGALVLEEESSDHFRIIDGQQRLATLSILVIAALHCLGAMVIQGVEPENNRKRIELLRTAFLGSEHPATLKTNPKLTLNQANRRFYEGVLVSLSTPASVSALPASEKCLWDALVYFKEKLSGKFSPGRDGAGLADFIYETIATRLQFIQVVVEDDAGAYTVFETLNARGLELTAGDLLKNYLLSIVHPLGEGELQRAQDLWNQIGERIKARDIPEFLRHYLNSMREFVRQERVYKVIRKDITTPGQVFTLLDELNRAAVLIEAIEDPSHPFWHEYPDAARTAVRNLNLYGVSQFRPLALAAWRSNDSELFCGTLRLCDALSFRYTMIAQRNTNRLEEVYNEAAVGVTRRILHNTRLVMETLRKEYVEDEEFKKAFAQKSIPSAGRKTKLIRYILCELERHQFNADLDWETTLATIEHVLPEHPLEGTFQEFAGDLHGRYLHRLGNYLLLEPKLNAKQAGNHGIMAKKAAYALSQYRSTRDFDHEEWTPRHIEARQAQMARLAASVWKF